MTFAVRVHANQAAKTGLKWSFMGGCVGKHEQSGLVGSRWLVLVGQRGLDQFPLSVGAVRVLRRS